MQLNMTLLVSKSSSDSNEPLNRTDDREKGEVSTFSHMFGREWDDKNLTS